MEAELDRRCPMCGGTGWVIDCNVVGRNPIQIELIECFHPMCDITDETRPEIASLVFKGPHFDHVSRHPTEGWIMSVSTPA